MSKVQLIITKDDDDNFREKKVFETNEISIGRDHTNDLQLPDKKKFVSRNHVTIQYQDGYYYLMDRDSRNGTYINDKRIKANYPYTLDEGSVFVVGEYTIEFSTVQDQAPAPSPSAPPPSDRTVVLSNPFEEEMQSLMQVLSSIEEKHQSNKELASKSSLEEALKMVKQNTKNFDTQPVVGESLVNGKAERPPEKQDTTEENTSTTVSVEGDSGVSKVLDASLEFFVNIFRFVSKFRTEFVGSTLVQTEDIMSVKNIQELKSMLFDPDAPEEQTKKRIEQIRIEMRKLVAHQMGLLEGYRESIKQGVPKLTKELSPAIVINEVSNEAIELGPVKIPYKIIPFAVKRKALRQLEEKHYELSEEDRGVIEKKIFRPPFIKKYLETISNS